MKPDGPVARRADYEVRPCAHADVEKLVRAHHYARGMSKNAVASHCLVRRSDGALVGAASWLPPMAAVSQSLGRAHGVPPRTVIALSRLVVAPGEPKNAAGMLLAASVRLLRRSDPRWTIAVTYADTAEGHTGTIYRATGWRDEGLRPGHPRWFDASGRLVSAQAARPRRVAEMQALGLRREAPKPKRRFTLRLSGWD